MSCYSYKFEDEIRFGIFHEFDIDTWKVNPLILGQEVSNIPDVVLDLRQQEVYVSKDTNIMEIYVVHEKWFTQNYLLYRDGMTNIELVVLKYRALCYAWRQIYAWRHHYQILYEDFLLLHHR